MGEGAKIVHFTPGRLRVRVEELRDEPVKAQQVQQMLVELDGVQKATVNPLTGSVLIQYDAEDPESFDALLRTAKQFGFLPTDVDTQQIRVRMGIHSNGDSNGHNGTSPQLRNEIVTLFSAANTKVAEATGGTSDLKVLVPVGLVVAGLLKLFFTKRPTMPNWYDYFWFAFSIFTVFNISARKTP